jgi:anti-sigma regulatory factor (Ser/Thr protein kinase)
MVGRGRAPGYGLARSPVAAVNASPTASAEAETFHHEALLYAGEREFLAHTLAFIREGMAQREAVLVAVSRDKIELLEQELGQDVEDVRFADMAEIGRNPATIIPVWSEFVEQCARSGRPCRGIGEPVWPERRAAALVECRNHEALLNVAFDRGFGWRLLCPYDTQLLSPTAIADACATHPFIANGGSARRSPDYQTRSVGWLSDEHPLPPPVATPRELTFGPGSLQRIRSMVAGFARRCRLAPQRVSDLVLAVNELVANSIRHGGGRGLLRLWREDDAVLCEVADRGWITDPLVGRRRPIPDQEGGRGLWITNQLCDLVQVRSRPGHCVVRVHMALPAT